MGHLDHIDGDHVEKRHGYRHHEHAEGIVARRDEHGNHKDARCGLPPTAHQQFGGENADPREEKDNDRELKGNSEGQKHLHDEEDEVPRLLINGRSCKVGGVANEPAQGHWQNHPTKPHAHGEQDKAEGNDGSERAALLWFEPGFHKPPNLGCEKRSAQNETQEEAKLQLEHERRGKTIEDFFVVDRFRNRSTAPFHEEVINARLDVVPNDPCADENDQGPNESSPQFIQVFDQSSTKLLWILSRGVS